MSENRECIKAMATVEHRLGQRRSAVITRDEFKSVGDYIEALEHDIQMLACENHSLLSQMIQPEHYQVDSEVIAGDHQDKCPGCGGVADNGYDRSWPKPNPYFCTMCELEDV